MLIRLKNLLPIVWLFFCVQGFAQDSSLVFLYRGNDLDFGMEIPVKLLVNGSKVTVYNNSLTVITLKANSFTYAVRNFFDNYFNWKQHTIKIVPARRYYLRCGFSKRYTQIELIPVDEATAKQEIARILLIKAAKVGR